MALIFLVKKNIYGKTKWLAILIGSKINYVYLKTAYDITLDV